MKKHIIFLLLISVLSYNLLAQNNTVPLYKNKSVAIEKRIDDLLSRMTLEEKILQLNQYTLGRSNNENNIESGVGGKLLGPIGAALTLYDAAILGWELGEEYAPISTYLRKKEYEKATAVPILK